jgi:hypothetical protein
MAVFVRKAPDNCWLCARPRNAINPRPSQGCEHVPVEPMGTFSIRLVLTSRLVGWVSPTEHLGMWHCALLIRLYAATSKAPWAWGDENRAKVTGPQGQMGM